MSAVEGAAVIDVGVVTVVGTRVDSELGSGDESVAVDEMEESTNQ